MMNRSSNIRFGGPITPMVKRLLIINGAIFLIQLAAGSYGYTMQQIFGLSHEGLVHEFKLWQIFTYMFLHGGWLHIIFNLLTLWMFAGSLEEIWGSKFFIKYYIYCGIGAGIFIAAMNYYIYSTVSTAPVPTIGASGALYGILLAYGMTWPNREVLLYFFIPVKIKYLVIMFGLIEFFGTLNSASGGGGISHIGHIGGLISGFVILKFFHSKQNRPAVKTANQKNPISAFLKKRRLEKKKRQIEKKIKAKNLIDSLLEKIARQGMSSLTPEEKKDLEWARKNYYPDDSETLH
ncbi:MAG: rhomboid family intramembrane serine protease [Spirochaetia bacterium]|jgi:membrane associated rhomboid family serine protease|nr:rhomboid family intramembrane serine protease [Spirochaetia bacterium]